MFEFADSSGITLEVTFYYSNNPYLHDTIDVKLLHNRRVIFCNWKEFMKTIKSTYKKEYKSILLSIYKEYFKSYIFNYIEEHPEFLLKCGWLNINNKKEFLSITYTEDTYPDFVKDLLDGNVNKHKRLYSLFSDLYKDANTIGNLFEFILYDPCILTVFAYSIHTILWNYIKNEEITSIFSLCIYGNNPSISKILANLLSNFFTIEPTKWTVIKRKYHVSATSLSQKNIDNLFLYNNIPIIITSKNNHFTKTSSVIKKIHQKREDGKVHINPVYISDFPIFADEILNCCSDSLVLQSEKFNIIKLREQFIGLIYNFIKYLSNISNHDIPSNIGKYNYIIKQYTERLTEDIFCNYLDMPLLKDRLDKCFSKKSLTYVLLNEWLDKYSPIENYISKPYLDPNYILKEYLIKKWLDQFLSKVSLKQQDKIQYLRGMLLEEILKEWYSVEFAHKPYISEETLPDQNLRKLYCSILEKWQFEQIKFNNLRKTILTEWLDTHFPEFWLYKAMDIFCDYLEYTPLNKFAHSIKKYAEKCFLPQMQKKSSKLSQPEANYLHLLYSFIQENLANSKNATWIWEGQEQREGKEFCYYLSSQQGLNKFNNFLSKHSFPIIQKRSFDQLLKQNKIIKIPKGNSNTWKRKKIFVYVFIKTKLDKFSLIVSN